MPPRPLVATVAAVALTLSVACQSPTPPPGADAGDSQWADLGSTDSAAVPADTAASPDSAEVAAAPWNPTATVPHQPGPTASGPLQAGLGVALLHGPIGVSMGGFAGRFTGVHTRWSGSLKGTAGMYGRMTAKALALRVGTETLVLVKAPLLTSDSYLLGRIEAAVQARTGVDLRGRIITGAGHSHHETARFWPIPPGLGAIGMDTFDYEVAELLAHHFAVAIQRALADLGPAEWAWAAHENWDPTGLVYRDRRGANDPTWGKDPRLTLVGVRRPGATAPFALVVNFPIHGTVLGDDNDLHNEDAPGYVEHKLEDALADATGKPTTVLLLQAAGGDASPGGDQLGHPGPARLERIGELAAGLILPKVPALTYKPAMDLAVRTVRLDIDYDHLYADADLKGEFVNEENVAYTWGGWQCVVPGLTPGQSMKGKPKQCLDLSVLLPAFGETLPFGELNQVVLTAAKLGDLGLITLPGEPTYSLVQFARQQVEGKLAGLGSLMVVGYAQDYFLYLTAPDDWMVGGYESQMSVWGPAAGRFFARGGLDLLTNLWAGKTQPTFWQASPYLTQPAAQPPRTEEAAVDAGQWVQAPPLDVSRTQVAELAFLGGDPAFSIPRVSLQRQTADGFVAVPARNLRPGATYDNTRYEMLTLYQPDPPPNADTQPKRKHIWRVRWEVPIDWPTGTYRWRIALYPPETGHSQATQQWESAPFAVHPAEKTTVQAERKGSQLLVRVDVQGQPYSLDGKHSWPKAGWRLLDRDEKHGVPARLRAPLQVVVQAGGQKLSFPSVAYDAAQKAHVVEVGPAAAAPGPWQVQAEVAGSSGPLWAVQVP
ncbi:MAG: hypothetical protein FJ100_02080 [Deltaproteobacteria bacterium]|nr:hypothetical protein [Deltaproteobacteria bacterium]